LADSQPQEFYIEPLDQDGKPLGPAGKGKPFKVTVDGPKGPVPVKQSEDPVTGKRTVVYEPNAPGNYHIEVTCPALRPSSLSPSHTTRSHSRTSM
jgi:hypothetical protein